MFTKANKKLASLLPPCRTCRLQPQLWQQYLMCSQGNMGAQAQTAECQPNACMLVCSLCVAILVNARHPRPGVREQDAGDVGASNRHLHGTS